MPNAKKNFLARLRDRGWKESPAGWLPPPPGKSTQSLPRVVAKPPRPKREGMNALEARYAVEVVEQEIESGQASSWFFESFRLKLGPKTFYTPDFMVIMADGTVSFREVKGFLREDASVKFKWAREQYPIFDFKMVTRRSGQWKEQLPPLKPSRLSQKQNLDRPRSKGVK
jgi:hypothetical protein